MIGILMVALMSMSAPQTVLPPAEASSAEGSELLDPFADRQVRSDATPAPSDLIDPFNHPMRRGAPVDCGEQVLRDPFAPATAPRTGATFPGLLDPFAR
jgi:hypothetical protein